MEKSPTKLTITGMHCASCVARVEKALQGVAGVQGADVNLATGEARLRIDPEAPPDLQTCVRAVEQAGYQARPTEPDLTGRTDHQDQQRAELRDLRRRVMVAVPATAAVLIIHMGGLHFPGSVWTVAALSALVTFWSGWSIVQRGITGLVRLAPDMDALVTLGTLTAFFTSLTGTLAPQLWEEPPLFYEAAATVICFVLIGRYLEQRARRETLSAIDALLDLQPPQATRWDNGVESVVSVDELQLGDVVRVRPGERIPIDGTIVEGQVSVDQSMVTGESIPVARESGDEVLAGTINLSGGMLVRVTKTGDATFLQKVAALVRDAQGTKAPIARLADKVAGIFVPVVLGIALFTFLIWLAIGPRPGHVAMGILAAVSVLVISCPCALGLATPTAVATAMGRAAQLGLLIRDGAALERAAAVDTVVFDKTGTLTEGRFTVAEVRPLDPFSGQEVLELAAEVERSSEHPLGRAIVEGAFGPAEVSESVSLRRDGNGNLVSLGMWSEGSVASPVRTRRKVIRFTSVPGQGATAEVDGQTVSVGNERFLNEQGINTQSLRRTFDEEVERGRTYVLVAVDGRLAGVVALTDIVKRDAESALQQLRSRGYELHLLTGDRRQTAQAVADQVGIDSIHAEVLPADKAEVVGSLQKQGRVVAMVGDGINDAPVLAAADVGLAMGAGTDVAIAAAAMTVVSGELGNVVSGLLLARRTMRIVRQNLWFAFVYNVIGIPLAAGVVYPATGWLLPPMFAAAAMSLSSVSVVTNSLRLRRR